ncbi:AI-2E family transporter [Patescibacteria group bacterium]|nr:AI-2E family transporter [Patescibacteria group bacterium]
MTENKQPININISTSTIIKVISIFLLLYFVYLIKDVLAILFIALIFSSALDPWVDWMQSKKIPRAAGILLIYFILFIIISSVFYLIIPPIAEQLGELAINFPRYLEKIISGFSAFKEYSIEHGLIDDIKENLGSMSSNLQKAAGGIFSTVTNIFGGIFSFFLVLVMTFYMVVEENAIKKLVWSITPAKHQSYIMQLINRMQIKIGLWLRGQLVLSFIIFVLIYAGLSILGVKYALVLALIAGLVEFVPYLGPMLAAIPAVFLAFTQAPMLALFVAALYYIIQLVENNILVPKIMQKAVGLNPIVSIAVLLMGFKIAGVAGAILSIPVATAVSVFINDLFDSKAAGKSEVES